ncbi:MAG: mannose-1-phosphate guanylyltransferase [Deltaproteobacteria bacterium]|nr:mannose-1-phosphate guanylyltransferase [Deltaproteobacteria bacterium]
MANHLHVILMAGGEGTRFAPLSTPERPKQFLDFFGQGSFLQQTFQRLEPLTTPERVYVSTQERYIALVEEQLPRIPQQNIIAEIQKKNTAPALAYMTREILGRDPEAIVASFPSDQVIDRIPRFQEIVRHAAMIAQQEQRIVTIGILPEWPSTDYGYIQIDDLLGNQHVATHKVRAFVEKPNAAVAESYLEAGTYLWNAGMFVFPAKVLLAEIKTYLPEIDALLSDFVHTMAYCREFFTRTPSISIDHGIMEHSKRIAVVKADFGWSDIGTWEGLKYFVERTGARLHSDVEKAMREMLARRP